MPAKLLFCVLFILPFYSNCYCSDTIKVPLKWTETYFKKPSTTNTPYLYSAGIKDSDELYKEVKFPENFPNLKLALFHFQYSQYLYYKYMSGILSRKDYDSTLADLTAWPDTADVVNRFIREYVIVGFQNQGGKILAFIDFNNNNDLSDETPIPFYQFPAAGVKSRKSKKPDVYKFTYDYYDGRKICNRTVSACITFDVRHLFRYPGSGGLMLDSPKHIVYEGETWVKGKAYNFSILGGLNVQIRRYAKLAIKEKPKKIVPLDYSYMPGDTIFLNDEYYKFAGVTYAMDTLFLTKLSGNLKPTGPYPGLFAPELKAETVEGKPFSLKALKGKYVVLHLHNTYCKSAREENNKTFSKVYEKYRNENAVFVSVASDDSLEKVKAHWKGFDAEWLKAYKYPGPFGKTIKHAEFFNSFIGASGSFYLIDPSGKVVSKIYFYGPETLMEACDKAFGKKITLKQILK